MRASIVLIFTGISLLISCNEKEAAERTTGKLQGLHKYYYPDGPLYLEITYKDSVPHGTFKQYFKSGQLFEETEYLNGAKHGLSKKFHDNGQLSTETTYDNNRIHGVQKKYRRDGVLAFEAPYYYDNPCVGLKEYFLSGKQVENYPTIVIRGKDELLKSSQYTLEVRLSDNTSSVQFYQGELTDGRFIGKTTIPLHTVDGVGKIYYTLPRGAFVMEKLNIIAKMKTDLNNYYITQVQYNLAVENK